MGQSWFDEYSLLHFASGIVAFFWGLTFSTWFVLHALFEIVENTDIGRKFINEHITMWPGGKPSADSSSNMIGDQASAMLGWWCAQQTRRYFH
jgi:electron transfer flavoprotein alpha/beta subunit